MGIRDFTRRPEHLWPAMRHGARRSSVMGFEKAKPIGVGPKKVGGPSERRASKSRLGLSDVIGPASRAAEQAGHRVERIDVARAAPRDELGDVDAAVAGLAVVHPALRSFAESVAEVPLAQARVLAHPAQHRRDTAVLGRVLGLRHAATIMAAAAVDTESVSTG